MMKEKYETPQTLKWYMENCLGKLVGKVFEQGDCVYTCENVWSEVSTQNLIGLFERCDFGDEGLIGSAKINLSYAKGMYDLVELIEGVNAEKVCPISYYFSSI